MPDTMPRIPFAEPNNGPPWTERVLHFWFWYDWNSTNKVIGLNTQKPPPIDGWQRLYRCSMDLSPPVEHDERTEIELGAYAHGGQDYEGPPEELAHWVARRFFTLAAQTAPTPVNSHWIGNPTDPTSTSLEMTTKGRRFQVTVKELKP